MQLTYKKAQSNIKPDLIDNTSCPGCVYIRRDLQQKTKTDENGQELTYWEYSEAFVTANEYETIKNQLIADTINDNVNTEAFDEYENKLNTGVLYTNGFKYKPKYINDYKKIMSDIETAVNLIKILGGNPSSIASQQFAVYDETGKTENMVMMTGLEVINLYMFLYSKKEQYFAEYKAKSQQINGVS